MVEVNEVFGFLFDLCNYGIGVQIFCDLGVQYMKFLINNFWKIVGFEGYGLSILDWVLF